MNNLKYKGIDMETLLKIQFGKTPVGFEPITFKDSLKRMELKHIESIKKELELMQRKHYEDAELFLVCEMAKLFLAQRNVLQKIIDRLEELESEAFSNLEKASEFDPAYRGYMKEQCAKSSAYFDAIMLIREEGGFLL